MDLHEPNSNEYSLRSVMIGCGKLTPTSGGREMGEFFVGKFVGTILAPLSSQPWKNNVKRWESCLLYHPTNSEISVSKFLSTTPVTPTTKQYWSIDLLEYSQRLKHSYCYSADWN